MTSTTIDKCSICLKNFNSLQTYTLQCGHCFHTECQILWFRNGHSTCPTCRNTDNNGNLPRCFRRTNQTAFQIMSHRARRKDAPIPLKRAYEKYKKSLEKQKDITKKMKELRDSVGKYSTIQKQILSLKRKKWTAWRTSRRLHREISNLCEIITVFSTNQH